MNRYSKTRLRQGLLPRQPRTAPEPESEPPPEDRDRGVAHEEQALLFDLAAAPPHDEARGSTS